MSGGSKPSKPKPTAHEKALAEVSTAQWNDYATRFAPLNQELLDRVKATDGKRQAAAGIAASDVEQAREGQTAATVAGLSAAGSKAGSGASNMAVFQNALGGGKARGLAQAAAVQGVDDNELMAKRKMVSFGRELSDDAHLSFEGSARRAAQDQIAQMKREADMNNFKMGLASDIAGTATGAYISKRKDAKLADALSKNSGS